MLAHVRALRRCVVLVFKTRGRRNTSLDRAWHLSAVARTQSRFARVVTASDVRAHRYRLCVYAAFRRVIEDSEPRDGLLGKDWDATARKMWLEFDAGTPRAGTVASLLNAFMMSPRRKVSPRTQADNEHEKLALMRSLGHCTLESVKPTTIAQYLEKRGAPVRANREISLLSRAFSWAVAQGLADRNPCLGVERNKEQSRKRSPSVAEFEAVAAKVRRSSGPPRVLRI